MSTGDRASGPSPAGHDGTTDGFEVSVIIPCHNSTRTLGLQLQALARQVQAPPFEVIIADNGSTDDLEGFLELWRDRLPLRSVEAGRLSGAAYARNVGMAAASADKWLFCDSDDVVARDWVGQGSAALDQVPVFSGPGLKVADGDLAQDLTRAWGRLDEHLPPGRPVQEGVLVDWPIVLGGNSGLRRETALAVGGYDAALARGVEDNDLACRLQQRGIAISFAPGVRILYRERSGLGSVFRASLVSGEWHMALVRRYDLWDRSPHLISGRWPLELARGTASGLKMVFRPRSRDWRGLASRLGLGVGMWRGWWRFRRRRFLPVPAVGVGLLDGAGRTRGRAVVFMPGIMSGGGAERYAVGTAAALAGLGYEAVLATTGRTDAKQVGDYFGLDLGSVAVVDISGPPQWARRLPRAIFQLVEQAGWARAVRDLGPDIFFNCLYRSELVGVGSRNIYICHFPHRLDETYAGLRRPYMAAMRWLQRQLVGDGTDFRDTYDLVCVNSRFSKEHCRERWHVEPRVLYPPCETMATAGQQRQRQIIVVGRMEAPVPGIPNKRLDVLVSAFVQLTDLQEQGWVLHVVGACPERSRPYVAELEAMASGSPVKFHPNATHEELQELYATSTLYWHAQGFGEDASIRPETQEHFGITTVEAMSAGAIPVVIDTAGPREVVEEVDGIHRWSTIPELLAETRRLAALGEAERAELSRRCQERARHFDTEHFRARLAEIVAGPAQDVDGEGIGAEVLAGRPVLLLSPHLDDALFSAAEIIRRGNTEVWTVFAGDPDEPVRTSWDQAVGFEDSHAHLAARRTEDTAALAGTGAIVRHLPCLDGAYTTPDRRAQDLDLLRREVRRWIDTRALERPIVAVPAGAGVPVPTAGPQKAGKAGRSPAGSRRALARLLQPLRGLKHRLYLRRRRRAAQNGLVTNPDHLAVRDVVIETVAGDDCATLMLVEDLPYLWWHPADDAVEAVSTRWHLSAVPGAFDVDRRWKYDHIKHYASQLDVMDAEHGRLSAPETLPPAERYWVLSSARPAGRGGR